MADKKRLYIFNRRRYDDNAANFMDVLTGASITTAQGIGIDRLFRDLKGEANTGYATSNIYSKATALYPMLYGTSDCHKYNMLDPRDLDAAFRLVFVGSPMHDSKGVKFNGVNQYARTFCAINSVNRAWGVYSQTNVQGNYCDIGCYGAQAAGTFLNHPTNGYYSSFAGNAFAPTTDTLGLHMTSKAAGAQVRNYKNGILHSTSATNLEATLPDEITIGAWANHPSPAWSIRQYSFAAIFRDNLTSTEHLNFRNALHAFHTVFNRAV